MRWMMPDAPTPAEALETLEAWVDDLDASLEATLVVAEREDVDPDFLAMCREDAARAALALDLAQLGARVRETEPVRWLIRRVSDGHTWVTSLHPFRHPPIIGQPSLVQRYPEEYEVRPLIPLDPIDVREEAEDA
jgi:hypothetical protein